MPYTLDQFRSDVRLALALDPARNAAKVLEPA